jgi:hypothetical protein
MMKDWMLLQQPEDVLILGGWVEQLEAAHARVNKFGTFFRNFVKFDGFGMVQI